jgi:hypothetical protein
MSAGADILKPDRLAWCRRAVPALYVLLIFSSVLGSFAYKLRAEGIFACPATGYGSNAYMTDCTAKRYGDYDHGAFWFGLEPQAQRAVAKADLLIVGSSRLQFAFSGLETAQWFSEMGISYYLLGFSNTENVVFFTPLLAKIHPRAKVYVINVDRFFDDRVSPPTDQILRDRDIQERYNEKQAWQSLHRGICGVVPLLCGTAVAVYRERETGVWQLKGTGRFETKDVDVSDGRPSNVERWDNYAQLGKKFIAQLPVDRSCVILTVVPTVETRRAEAMAIAARLGLDLLAPQIDGLRTFDGSHLEEASAERWSAAFLREAGPRIRKCVREARPSS